MRCAVGLLSLIVFLGVARPAAASAPALSKSEARREGLRFVTPFVDMLDMERTVQTRMVPPRACRRLRSRTVKCRFSATLADGRVVRSYVVVRRQRDGLLGFQCPLDVLAEGV